MPTAVWEPAPQDLVIHNVFYLQQHQHRLEACQTRRTSDPSQTSWSQICSWTKSQVIAGTLKFGSSAPTQWFSILAANWKYLEGLQKCRCLASWAGSSWFSPLQHRQPCFYPVYIPVFEISFYYKKDSTTTHHIWLQLLPFSLEQPQRKSASLK